MEIPPIYNGILDGASELDVIRADVVESLGLPVKKCQKMVIDSVTSENDTQAVVIDKIATFDLLAPSKIRNQPRSRITIEAYVIPNLLQSLPDLPLPAHKIFPSTRKLRMAAKFPLLTKELHFLVGAPSYYKISNGKDVHPQENQACRFLGTVFGYVLHGNIHINRRLLYLRNKVIASTSVKDQISAKEKEELDSLFVHGVTHLDATRKKAKDLSMAQSKAKPSKSIEAEIMNKDEAGRILNQLWTLETMGIRAVDDESSLSHNDKKMIEHFYKHVKTYDNRIEVQIPFRKSTANFGNNFKMTLHRSIQGFQSLERKREKWQRFDGQIDKWLQKGMIEEFDLPRGPWETSLHDKPNYRTRETHWDQCLKETFAHADEAACTEAQHKKGSNVLVDPTDVEAVKNMSDFLTEPPEGTDITCFTPVHMVTRKGKERVVLASNAKSRGGHSLNDRMFAAPVPVLDLHRLIINWRMYPYVFVTDIKSFFLNIKIQEWQKHLLSFIYCYERDPKKLLRGFRFVFLPFGLISSSHLSAEALQYHLTSFIEQYPEKVALITDSIFVDDVSLSLKSSTEAMDLYIFMEYVLSLASLSLAKYQTNCGQLKAMIPKEKQVEADSDNLCLGIVWDDSTDLIRIQITEANLDKAINEPLTKRTAASALASLYDPLGLLAPLMIWPKVLMRKLIIEIALANPDKSQMELWNIRVPDPSIVSEFRQWAKDIKSAKNITFPRCLTEDKPIKGFTLIACGDSSNLAFGATIHLRTEYEDSSVSVNLMCCKQKVNQQLQTLPRMELSSVTLATVLATSVAKNLRTGTIPVTIHLLTDSMISFWQIKNARPEKFNSYIFNRVSKIQERIERSNVHWVPTDLNPADLVTRHQKIADLKTDEKVRALYLHGPDFFRTLIWPPTEEFRPSAEDQDLKQSKLPEEKIVAATMRERVAPIPVKKDFDCISYIFSKTLDFDIALRTANIVIRALHAFSKKSKPLLLFEHCDFDKDRPLAITRNIAIKLAQHKYLIDEISTVATGHSLKVSNRLHKLAPFLDTQGILRATCRYSAHGQIAYEILHPVILPRQAAFTHRLTEKIHRTFRHPGAMATMHHMSDEFIVIGGIRYFKTFVNSCVACRKKRAVGTKLPLSDKSRWELMKDFVPYRACSADAFEFGKNAGYLTEEGNLHHYYVQVITCSISHHSQAYLLPDYSAEEVLNTFRKHFARYGVAEFIAFDGHASNIRASGDLMRLQAAVLAETLAQLQKWGADTSISGLDEVVRHEIRCLQSGPQFYNQSLRRQLEGTRDMQPDLPPQTPDFTPEPRYREGLQLHARSIARYPQSNGRSEVTVRLYKTALRAAIKGLTPTRSDLEVLLEESSAVCNARPLYGLLDRSIGEPAISPQQLVSGSNLVPLGLLRTKLAARPARSDPDFAQWESAKLWKMRRHMLKNFRDRYIKEYILNVRSQKEAMQNRRNFRADDVVLVADNESPRTTWPIARVLEAVVGREGITRSIKVQLPDRKILTRAAQHAILLFSPKDAEERLARENAN